MGNWNGDLSCRARLVTVNKSLVWVRDGQKLQAWSRRKGKRQRSQKKLQQHWDSKKTTTKKQSCFWDRWMLFSHSQCDLPYLIKRREERVLLWGNAFISHDQQHPWSSSALPLRWKKISQTATTKKTMFQCPCVSQEMVQRSPTMYSSLLQWSSSIKNVSSHAGWHCCTTYKLDPRVVPTKGESNTHLDHWVPVLASLSHL